MTEKPRNTTELRKKGGWLPKYDLIILGLLQGKTQRAIAEEMGLSASWLSRLNAWPVFAKRLRQRRAALVEASDGLLIAADQLATAVLVKAMKLIEPQQYETIGKDGKTRLKTMPADPGLALSAARAVKTMNRNRVERDYLVSRLDELEQKLDRENYQK